MAVQLQSSLIFQLARLEHFEHLIRENKLDVRNLYLLEELNVEMMVLDKEIMDLRIPLDIDRVGTYAESIKVTKDLWVEFRKNYLHNDNIAQMTNDQIADGLKDVFQHVLAFYKQMQVYINQNQAHI